MYPPDRPKDLLGCIYEKLEQTFASGDCSAAAGKDLVHHQIDVLCMQRAPA